MSFRVFVPFAVAFLSASPAVAFRDYDQTGYFAGQYVCFITSTAGLAWKEALGKWDSARFRVEDDDVRHLMVAALKVKSTKRGKYDAMEYAILIKQGEKSWPVGCASDDSEDGNAFMTDNGSLRCSSGFTDYRFNFQNGRFLEHYWIGYIEGHDSTDSETPYVSAGICHKTSN